MTTSRGFPWKQAFLTVAVIAVAGTGGVYLKQNPVSYREVRSDVQPILPEMVPVPAGPFKMGNPGGSPYEQPVHEVNLSAYAIGRYEVTCEEFRRFCDATGRPYPRDPEEAGGKDYFLKKPDHPVLMISWNDMAAYCLWLKNRTGRDFHMPTEAQWEKAARGGLDENQYPWGNERKDGMARMNQIYYGGPVAVGSFPPNGYGIHDMAGNANEAVADWYDEWYYSRAPVQDPLGPTGLANYFSLIRPEQRSRKKGRCHVVRGGSWRASWDWKSPGPEGRLETPVECGAREYLYQAPYDHFDLGFRVAEGGVYRQ
jgi:formylglycine-generating enzyme required for sulfatase activity